MARVKGAHSVPLNAASARVPLATSSSGGMIPAMRSVLKRAVAARVARAQAIPSTWIARVTESQGRCTRSTAAAATTSRGEG